jgi:hypothetical protein
MAKGAKKMSLLSRYFAYPSLRGLLIRVSLFAAPLGMAALLILVYVSTSNIIESVPENVIEFTRSTQGLLIAIAGLIFATLTMMKEQRALLIRWWPKYLRDHCPETIAKTSDVECANWVRLRITKKRILATFVPLALALAIFAVRLAYPMPLNVRLTNQAWHAYYKDNYKSAIGYAEKCIHEFGQKARDVQRDLETANEPEPPVGVVSDQDVRRRILARGPLNDVATCYHIVGRSAEKLNNMDKARDAYQAASKLSYGRCWDRKIGCFWSPAEDAMASLERL